ncbi:MAG: NAD(P)-binding protein [Pseudomonadales bacterium]|nr:NAD(P)-binding protein [Pseudomonadales bacterium]
MKIAVIGAGPCGLIATKTLRQYGIEASCFETSSFLGGHWKIDNPSGKSAAYESLTTNTNKVMSRLSDFEMPSEWPDLPSHELMYEWWCSYAETFDLLNHINFEHEVIEIKRDPSQWIIQYKNFENTHEANFDGVVLASGNFWLPKTPELPGNFSGRTLHSLDYRSPTRPFQCVDQRVLVVGSGNTGCEIALELSKHGAKEVFLSARSGNWILPKYIEGPDGLEHIAARVPLNHPLDEVPWALRVLPESWRNKVFSKVAQIAFKRQFSSYAEQLVANGMPPPPENPLTKRPAVADGLAEALSQEQLRAVPAIKDVTDHQVTFTNGVTAEIDTIIFATGFHLSYPYLDQEILNTANDDMTLFRGLMHPQHHSLFVVGVSRPSGGFWPVAEAQSHFIGKLLTNEYKLPGQRTIDRHSNSVLQAESYNPALYGYALREESQRKQ